jgi:uncharacterized repeat protein (TIGR03803 family)
MTTRYLTIIRIAALLLVALMTFMPAQAQTYTVLHTFTGRDGTSLTSGVTMDRGGNLYGTASLGGHTGGNCFSGCGTVYKLTNRNSNWSFTPLYLFSYTDGSQPQGRVVFGPDGKLYGTTTFGGAFGNGVVFSLQPPPTACPTTSCLWKETVLYSFSGGADGQNPGNGDLAFDQAGNIYGTTTNGGNNSVGTVYKLSSAHGIWTETVLYSFGAGPNDGQYPYAGVVLDSAGTLYGTTFAGGFFGGTVYELSPVGSGWTENILHSFGLGSDGYQAYGGLIFDRAGNLYGVTSIGGDHGGGSVYELSPSNGGWAFNVLFGNSAYQGPMCTPAMNLAGELFGTIYSGGQEVFRLTPSNGQWNLTGFSGGVGGFSMSNVVFDAAGNGYLTASDVVFEITP